METRSDRPKLRRDATEKRSMDEMLLALDHLFEREESTAKTVLACLYDLGAANISYYTLRHRVLQAAFRPVTKVSKPVFLFFGLRWFKANCPFLIADWLRSLVEFHQTESETDSGIPAEILPPPETVSPLISERERDRQTMVFVERSDREIRRLNGQVRLLTGTLLVTVAVLGGMLAWLGYELHVARGDSPSGEPAMAETRSETLEPSE